MSIIKADGLIAQANQLRSTIRATTIPYVAGGMTIKGMDCQGMVEYLLIQAGVPKTDCNLAGSNAHYRACIWTGTPEECKAKFGKIPGGAALFILEQDGSEPNKYKVDGIGNASHMGIWTGEFSLAASASRGKVIESNFAGKSINGGWNRVGLLPWVDYSLPLTEEQASTIVGTAETSNNTASAWNPRNKRYTYKPGKPGAGVRDIQHGLNRLGESLNIDGEFGPLTEAAVKRFQESVGIKIDGVVGPETWAALIQSVNSS